MSMMSSDELFRRRAVDLPDFERPIENEAASSVICHASQLAAAKNLEIERAQEPPCPLGVFRHFEGKLFVQSFAARLEHPFMVPDLMDLDVRGLTAKHAGREGIR
ncbi:hypothetical protein CCS01_12515 [Rhodopila globiformis]|uniref:Uncharacterized protein n=1 Tax=Rhodopila globiformis TaxID=1071 RepID=A0A2S6NHP5_RHOGL|nr:hypothetical protein CCS01_12515 [Rhodopila globiformis]